MSTVTGTVSPAAANPLTAGRLPTWSTWAALLVSLVAGMLLTGVLGDVNPALGLAVGAVIFLAVMHVWSLIVEGSRKATDRFAKHLVAAAFLLALIPLVWVLYSVLAKGLDRLDPTYTTTTTSTRPASSWSRSSRRS